MTALRLDAQTLQFCADLARTAADGIEPVRAHYAVAAGVLRVLAEEIDALARGDLPPSAPEAACAA